MRPSLFRAQSDVHSSYADTLRGVDANQRTSATNDGGARERADGLKTAFAADAGANISGDEKGRLQQRLIAGTNMAKRDVVRAREQLARFNDEWNARKRGKDEREDGTDR